MVHWCRFYGSAFLRCLPFAMLSGAETALLYVFWGDQDKAAWRHPYPYALSAFIVGFVVVYRWISLSNPSQLQAYQSHLSCQSLRLPFERATCVHNLALQRIYYSCITPFLVYEHNG